MRHQYIKSLFYPGVCLLFALYLSAYIVQEGQQAIVFRRGVPVSHKTDTPLPKQPGLHFKLPFWEEVVLWDTRLQITRDRSPETHTADQHSLRIDYTLAWRVSDPVRYIAWRKQYAGTTQAFLTELFNQQLEKWINKNSLGTLITAQQSWIAPALKKQLSTQGIQLVSAHMTQWILAPDTAARILTHMRKAEAQLAAEQLQSSKTAADAIRTQATAKSSHLLTQTTAEVIAIRSEGERSALRLYLEAAQKHPHFAKFYQQLNNTQQVSS